MPASASAPRRGRPLKFGRPAQLVTLTLPEDVITWLGTIDRDTAWAVVKLYERSAKAARTRQRRLAELVHIPGQKALILVRPESLQNLTGVSIIPLADGRGFLALDPGRGVADLELAVLDRLEAPGPDAAEREALGQLRGALRQWRQEGIEFESRSIIVARQSTGRGRAGRPSALPSMANVGTRRQPGPTSGKRP